MQIIEWFARMLRLLACTLVLGGCELPRRNASHDSFALCGETELDQIVVDYEDGQSLFSDVRSPVAPCTTNRFSCMAEPFPFAVPPDLPKPTQTISWKGGVYEFLIIGLKGGKYNIETEDSRYRYRYSYDERVGIVTLNISDASFSDTLYRCYGSLTFHDLQRLLRTNNGGDSQIP